MIEHENNSGELEAGIDIPLKTVQIVGWGKHAPGKEFQRDSGIKLLEWLFGLHLSKSRVYGWEELKRVYSAKTHRCVMGKINQN